MPFVCYTDNDHCHADPDAHAWRKHKPRKLRPALRRAPKNDDGAHQGYFTHNKVKMLDGTDPLLD